MEQSVMDKSKNPPSRNKVGDASNSIADKQLREAIYEILKMSDAFLGDPLEQAVESSYMKELLQLFHTYGNRERIDEIKSLKTKKVKGAELVEMKWIDKRIAELNREVEITDEDIKKGWPKV